MSDSFMQYFFNKFKETELANLTASGKELEGLNKELLATKLANIEVFVAFVDKYLSNTPPVAFDYLCEGNGVILANGERIRFANKAADEFKMDTGSVPVTNMNIGH